MCRGLASLTGDHSADLVSPLVSKAIWPIAWPCGRGSCKVFSVMLGESVELPLSASGSTVRVVAAEELLFGRRHSCDAQGEPRCWLVPAAKKCAGLLIISGDETALSFPFPRSKGCCGSGRLATRGGYVRLCVAEEGREPSLVLSYVCSTSSCRGVFDATGVSRSGRKAAQASSSALSRYLRKRRRWTTSATSARVKEMVVSLGRSILRKVG